MSGLFGVDWSHPSSIGYPVIFGGVLIGSIVPIIPTGAVVGAGAALAVSGGDLNLVLVILVAMLGALVGDLVTFAAGQGGRGALTRFFEKRQSAEKLASAREKFTQKGWLLVVVGRMVPAGRIPVLLAAGALSYPWRRLVPAAAGACLLWAVAYALLGVVSGGLFDNPLVATLIATTLILLVTVVVGLLARRRERRRASKEHDRAGST
ncbi:DedA family protein [Actinophytocola oryzae]|uniref:Membrane protein DedA with SNARE-associated domain n=1 Tax=Actinophytocola oryzae TaxID=502181 RepID=A0A4R7VY12_9PSEU|nr:VTT domain-containing protein [Actinophytocola oryzae]TDV55053.1 membrane protein DedA with SNARE-associated domain [Actinophytocola oryzae]